MGKKSNRLVRGSIAKHALVLYSEGTSKGLEMWDVHEGELVNPRPIGNKFIKDLYFIVKPFRPEEKAFSGPVPKGTLWMDRAAMAFFRPAQLVKLRMEKAEKDKKTAVIEKTAFMPATVVLYQGPEHDIMIFWAKGSYEDVASGASILIGAELPNTDLKGNFCLGSAMMNVKFKESLASMQKHCWNAIVNSEFNEWRRPETSACMKLMMDAADDLVKQRRIEQLDFGDDIYKKLLERPWKSLNECMLSFLGKDA